MLGQTVIGFPAPDYKTPDAALAGAETFLKAYADDPLIVPAVAPHAIYTTSDDTLQAARTLADRYGKPLIIHLSETKTEFDEAVQKRKKTPTAALNDLGVLQGWTLAAHAVWLDPADFGLLRAAGTGIAHCPSSNMMLASGIAPVLKMLKAGIPVGLGTDGVAGSNNDHDMMEEMDLAAKLQKVSSGDPTALSAEQAFAMATIMGAQAMGMSKITSSLLPAKIRREKMWKEKVPFFAAAAATFCIGTSLALGGYFFQKTKYTQAEDDRNKVDAMVSKAGGLDSKWGTEIQTAGETEPSSTST